VDEDNMMLEVFSTSDLCGNNVDSTGARMGKSVLSFVRETKGSRDLLTLPAEGVTFGNILEALVGAHAHQLWLLDVEGRPVGTVTQTDLLATLVRFRVPGEALRPEHIPIEEAPSPGFVVLSVQGASNLPKGAYLLGSSRNPYVVAKAGDVILLRTKTVVCSQDPVFPGLAVVVEVAESDLAREALLTFEVWDENHGAADVMIATVNMPSTALQLSHGRKRATRLHLEPQVATTATNTFTVNSNTTSDPVTPL
jgi:hypothetical protein